VPFKMRRKMLAPINTVKHYVQHPSALLLTGTIVNQPIVLAVVAPATGATNEVREGAVIKAVYIERWVIGDSAATVSQFTLTIEKKRQAEPDQNFTNSQNLSAYPNKKNILYTTQGIVGSVDGAPTVPVFRQYIMIPKGKQRFGAGDELMVNIACITPLRHCGIETYKEYI